MTTSSTEPETRAWRSRAFVQPLLVTILGVWVVPALVFLAWGAFFGPRQDSSPCTGECGTVRLAAGFVTGIYFLVAWSVAVVIVGFLAGRSSPDAWLALRAVLLGVMLPPVVVAVLLLPGAIADSDDVLSAILTTLAGAAFVGVVVLIPTALGLWAAQLSATKRQRGGL